VHKVFVDSKNNNWILGNSKGLGYGIYCSDHGAEKFMGRKHSDVFVPFDSALLRVDFFRVDKDDSLRCAALHFLI